MFHVKHFIFLHIIKIIEGSEVSTEHFRINVVVKSCALSDFGSLLYFCIYLPNNIHSLNCIHKNEEMFHVKHLLILFVLFQWFFRWKSCFTRKFLSSRFYFLNNHKGSSYICSSQLKLLYLCQFST